MLQNDTALLKSGNMHLAQPEFMISQLRTVSVLLHDNALRPVIPVDDSTMSSVSATCFALHVEDTHY